MRPYQIISSFFLIIFVLFCAPSVQAFDDAILAIVNDEAITVKDLQDYLKSVYSQLRIEGKSPEEIKEVMAQYEQKGIDQLIDDRIILSAADKLGVMIKPKAIDDRLEEIKKRYSSYQDFLNSIVKEGMTVSEIRKKIENQFKGQVMVEKEVRGKINVNPQEVTEYFNAHSEDFTRKPKVYVDSIFVKSLYGRDEARAKIDKALGEIKGGADFPSVSAHYSELPSVGEINENDLRPELRAKIISLAIGEVSEVVVVENGFYIFKLEGRMPEATATLKEVKDVIYQQLFEEKFKKRFKEWVDGLRKTSYVEIKK
jgi:parvulin-like peptidyl-prolyl isomerase